MLFLAYTFPVTPPCGQQGKLLGLPDFQGGHLLALKVGNQLGTHFPQRPKTHQLPARTSVS